MALPLRLPDKMWLNLTQLCDKFLILCLLPPSSIVLYSHIFNVVCFELGIFLPVTRPRGFQILLVLSFYCFAVVFIYWRKRRGGFYIYASCFYFIPSHDISSIPITRPIGCLLGPLIIILCFYSGHLLFSPLPS